MLKTTINKNYILLITLLLILLVGGLLVLSQTTIKAQDTTDNTLASLIQKLNETVIAAGGEIVIHFSNPVAGILTELAIPFDQTDRGEPRYTIVDIGQDYMCYRDNTGEVKFISCIPFSNIASISYTELP